ncbi:hypothetical protein KCP71_12895 [Salmonella enterica subsp. enterica]|nr:hypothetical protein KCP71_12895 [Salmonella enterica subsp. enterica]
MMIPSFTARASGVLTVSAFRAVLPFRFYLLAQFFRCINPPNICSRSLSYIQRPGHICPAISW